MRLLTIALIGLSAGPVWAQQSETAPLSAIDWLSDSVNAPAPVILGKPINLRQFEPQVATTATMPGISVQSLDSTSPDTIGLLASSVTGLPPSLWSASDASTLTALVRAERVETLPALQELILTLMLAEANAPISAGSDAPLFLARVDKLLEIGALEQAQSLLEAANSSHPEVFRRLFDVALLTGTEDTICKTMRERPVLAPSAPARIMCLARGGDWSAAALILNTGRALGDITPEQDALLQRFLDPDLFEGEAPLPVPTPVTPLIFRMHAAIGEAISTSALPRAFAQADLEDTAGWRNQLEAAERLARNGALSENTLLAIYTARKPAASGGIWDRAAAFQAFDAVINPRALAGSSTQTTAQIDPDAVAARLPAVWEAMTEARLEIPFARLYAKNLAGLPLGGAAATLAYRIGLLSPDYETAARNHAPTTPDEIFLNLLAVGEPQISAGLSQAQAAVALGFNMDILPERLQSLIDTGKLGEAILIAISTFDSGRTGDPSQISQALALFRAVGLEDIARRLALQYLLLDRTA